VRSLPPDDASAVAIHRLASRQAYGAAPAVTDARRRAEEYLLERRLLRSLSTGEIIDPAWTQFALRVLDWYAQNTSV
jgi:hypothetical protein